MIRFEDMGKIKSGGKIQDIQELPLLTRGVPNGLDVETDNDVKTSWAIRHGDPRDPIWWATTLTDGHAAAPAKTIICLHSKPKSQHQALSIQEK